MKNVYHVGSGELTFDLIERIINENLKLELAPEAKERIQKCRDYLDKKTAESAEPLYGITTGFGSLCSKNISQDELGTLQENLIKSHACSVGEEIRPVIIKLMMLLKAHALSLGHSGVQVITVQRILDFFNNDVMPIVYDRGSLGASGDLAPLANLFLPLIGVGDVYYKGRKREAISVLDEFGWEPVKLMSKEGLALLNGTQFMSANGVFAILKAFRLSKKADLIAALSLEAFDGRIDPFMDCIQQIRPHKGQIETGENFRKLLEGSELIARPGKHVQDPYSFRCIPQVHGATKDAIRYVSSVLLTEINSVTDNPTIFPDEDRIISGGNFQASRWLFRMIFGHRPCRVGEYFRTPYRSAYHGTARTAGIPGCQPRLELGIYDSPICRRFYGKSEQNVLLCRQQRFHRLQQRTRRPCKHGCQCRHEALSHHGQPGAHPFHRTDECRAGHRLPPSAKNFTRFGTFPARIPQGSSFRERRHCNV